MSSFIFVPSGQASPAVQDQTPVWVDVRSFAPSYQTARDGVVDWTSYIQQAIDYVIAHPVTTVAGTSVQAVGTVYLPPGRYKISQALRILKGTPGALQFVSLRMLGDTPSYGGLNTGTILICDSAMANSPLFVTQGARTVIFENLNMIGVNTWFPSQYAGLSTLYNSAVYEFAGRTNRYSPHTAIVTDPFSVGVSAPDRYPAAALLPYYATGAQKITSSDVRIISCTIDSFICGAAFNTAGDLAMLNNENFLIDTLTISSVRDGLAFCQAQSRNIVVRNLKAVAWKHVVNGFDYGTGAGACPNITDANLGIGYQAMWVRQTGQVQTVKNLYLESSFALGLLGGGQTGDTTTFEGCTFKLADTPAGFPALLRGALLAPTTFLGCQWTSGNELISLFTLLNLSFVGSHFFTSFPPISEAFWLGGLRRSTYFFATSITARPELGQYQVFTPTFNYDDSSALAISNKKMLMPGGTFYLLNNPNVLFTMGAWGTEPFVFNSTVDVFANGTASFTLANAQYYLRVGDHLSCNQGFVNYFPSAFAATAVNGAWGRVAAIDTGTGLVSIDQTADWLPVGSYSLQGFVVYWRRWHSPTTGTTTNLSDMITNVNQTVDWFVGQRIRGTGIPDTSYILAVTANTIQISQPCTASNAGVRIYDDDVRQIATTAY